MDFYLAQSIVLEVTSGLQWVFLVVSIWWADYRTASNAVTILPVGNASSASGGGGATGFSERPLPYQMRRIGLFCATVLLAAGVDCDSKRGVYPMSVVTLATMIIQSMFMAAVSVWIVGTAKALYRQLNRPLPPSLVTWLYVVPSVYFAVNVTCGGFHFSGYADRVPIVFIQGITACLGVLCEAIPLTAVYLALRAHLLKFIENATKRLHRPTADGAPATAAPKDGASTNGVAVAWPSKNNPPPQPPTNAASGGVPTPLPMVEHEPPPERPPAPPLRPPSPRNAPLLSASAAIPSITNPTGGVTSPVHRSMQPRSGGGGGVVVTVSSPPPSVDTAYRHIRDALARLLWRVLAVNTVAIALCAYGAATTWGNVWTTPAQFVDATPPAFFWLMWSILPVVVSIANPFPIPIPCA